MYKTNLFSDQNVLTDKNYINKVRPHQYHKIGEVWGMTSK